MLLFSTVNNSLKKKNNELWLEQYISFYDTISFVTSNSHLFLKFNFFNLWSVEISTTRTPCFTV